VLQRGETYSIEVSGSFYMGRWYRNGRSIINDACYEFNAHNQPASIPVLQNSLGVSYCSFYNPDHYYQSSPFVSDGRPLWFRIYDTDYRDNRGGLNVSVFWHRTASAPYNQEFQSIKLFNALKQQSSNNFKHNRFPEVYVNTSSWDTMPYHMSAPVRLTLTVDYGKEVYLSSKRNKKSGIYVDNFLMFVVESAEGTKIFSVGRVPKHTYRSEEVTRVSPNNLHPGVVNLTKYLPHNTVVNMTVYALDFGGHAGSFVRKINKFNMLSSLGCCFCLNYFIVLCNVTRNLYERDSFPATWL
ncbi:MAG: hypothetical protein CSA42_08495, partial [Gammaproteobacteria bacterium]